MDIVNGNKGGNDRGMTATGGGDMIIVIGSGTTGLTCCCGSGIGIIIMGC